MGITDKMRGLALNVQEGVKSSSISLAGLTLRLVSGFFLGLTIAFIGQELIHYGIFLLLFTTLIVLGLFFRVSREWTIPHVLIFDLICVLVAQLLRMYILLAP